ncbi:MAG: SDR family NAD(P)-dependent oxidoreductase [Gammaproteobacteria bacterium AqS3]|nr:SDR family NAD(P)-dependent oxidoreductase [Gammaproteobacteria bacterium AqS3]
MSGDASNGHPALIAGNNAVVTGGASGIGLATVRKLLERGLSVLVADRDQEALERAAEALRQPAEAGGARVECTSCDVGDFDSVRELAARAEGDLGPVHFLFNNAGVGLKPSAPWENLDEWRAQLQINLWGVVHGVQAFVPAMLEHGAPAAVVCTGSKQGITKPPGNAAYNLSKAGVVAYTEMLAHALGQVEGCRISAHLLVPGFTYTGMISRFLPEKPDAAWTPEQVTDFLIDHLAAGDFYILCPDNDVTPELDRARIQWNADDLIQGRPALSRWCPDFAEDFEAFVSDYLGKG